MRPPSSHAYGMNRCSSTSPLYANSAHITALFMSQHNLFYLFLSQMEMGTVGTMVDAHTCTHTHLRWIMRKFNKLLDEEKKKPSKEVWKENKTRVCMCFLRVWKIDGKWCCWKMHSQKELKTPCMSPVTSYITLSSTLFLSRLSRHFGFYLEFQSF